MIKAFLNLVSSKTKLGKVLLVTSVDKAKQRKVLLGRTAYGSGSGSGSGTLTSRLRDMASMRTCVTSCFLV